MTSVASERRIVAGDTTRVDLFVHALAQLPDEARLTLSASGAERARLEALARAYAIDERVEFTSSGDSRGAPEFSTMGEFVEAVGVPDDPPSSSMRAGASLDGERVAVVTNFPAPYRLPLFRGMHERLAADGATLRVFFLSDTPVRSWMNETPDGFEYDVLSSVSLPVRSYSQREHRPRLLRSRGRSWRVSYRRNSAATASPTTGATQPATVTRACRARQIFTAASAIQNRITNQ